MIRYMADLKITRMISSARGFRKYDLGGFCKSCGKCCKTPMIPIYPLFFYFKTFRWLVLKWHHMINGFKFIGEDRGQKCYIFQCTHYVSENGQCDSYESRPGMCRDYPKNLLDSAAPIFIEGCGHQAILKSSVRLQQALENTELSDRELRKLKTRLYINTDKSSNDS